MPTTELSPEILGHAKKAARVHLGFELISMNQFFSGTAENIADKKEQISPKLSVPSLFTPTNHALLKYIRNILQNLIQN